MSEYIGGPSDGRAVEDRLTATKAPWVCVRPAGSTERHLYVSDPATGNFAYRGICGGTDHDHFEITCG